MSQVLRACKLIVWDESTMAHKGGFEALSRTIKDIRDNDGVMGGVTVLLAGDFRQTLPVVPRDRYSSRPGEGMYKDILYMAAHLQTVSQEKHAGPLGRGCPR